MEIVSLSPQPIIANLPISILYPYPLSLSNQDFKCFIPNCKRFHTKSIASTSPSNTNPTPKNWTVVNRSLKNIEAHNMVSAVSNGAKSAYWALPIIPNRLIAEHPADKCRHLRLKQNSDPAKRHGNKPISIGQKPEKHR